MVYCDDALCAGPDAFDAVTPNVKDPGAVTEPLRTPPGLRLSVGGRLPVTAHV